MPKIAWLGILLVAFVLAVIFLPVTETLQQLLGWIDANRSVAWLVYIAVYVLATVLMLPGSILTLGAGFLFGLGFGYLVVAIASVTGASCAFLVGRFLARDWVEGKLTAMPRFAALDRAVQGRGALIVLLTRLSPVFPFNLLNYAFGLTSVNFVTYAVVSWIGMIPGTVLYVYLGSVASDLSGLFSGELDTGAFGGWLFYLGLLATLVLTIVLTRIASKVLSEQLGDAEESSNTDADSEADAGAKP